MSKSSSKSSSSSTATTNSTTTPTVAPWLNQGYQDYASQIGKYATTDPTSYVTGSNSTLDKAFGSAQNLGGGQSFINSGANIASNIANTASPGVSAAIIGQSDIDKFLNPYLSQVLDTTMADYDVNSGRVRAAQDAQAAKNRAFGGSNFAVREAQTEGELARGRATTGAGIRSTAYNTALQAAQQEADRRQAASLASAQLGSSNLDRQLSAAGLLGQFGSTTGNEQRANLGAMLTSGGMQRDIAQEQANALPAWLQNIGALYGSIPIGSFTSLNENGTSSGTQQGKTSSTGISMGWSPTKGFSFGG
jgi:hypothetical protein